MELRCYTEDRSSGGAEVHDTPGLFRSDPASFEAVLFVKTRGTRPFELQSGGWRASALQGGLSSWRGFVMFHIVRNSAQAGRRSKIDHVEALRATTLALFSSVVLTCLSLDSFRAQTVNNYRPTGNSKQAGGQILADGATHAARATPVPGHFLPIPIKAGG